MYPMLFYARLSITPSASQSVEAAIEAYLAPRRLLVVLDNCEHILESAPRFTDWLTRAPQLKLLCTGVVCGSICMARQWPVPPLPVPDLAQPPDVERWGQLPAMQLLLARVRATEPAFSITADNLLPLAALCVALDGLPLALELAAVRLRDVPPAALVQQLLLLRGNGRLSSTWLQAQTKRNVAERHHTLQAAIDWSVRRLPSSNKTPFSAWACLWVVLRSGHSGHRRRRAWGVVPIGAG